MCERGEREAEKMGRGRILRGLISRGMESVLGPDGYGELLKCLPVRGVYLCGVMRLQGCWRDL